MLKKLCRLSTVLPIAVGIIICTALSWLGHTDDAPGAVAIGLALFFGFTMLAARNAGIIKRGFFIPFVLLGCAIGGLILNSVLLLDGEFNDYPNMAYIGYTLGILMIVTGVFMLRRNIKRNT
jgi:hypothetical protein